MKKFLILLLFVNITMLGQTSSNELTAEGTARTNIIPDIAVLTIHITKENEVEKKALKELNEEVLKLQQYLQKLGFSDKQIKISEYDIHKYDYDEKKDYIAKNSLSIEFRLDYKLLDAFYREMQSGNFNDVLVDFDTDVSAGLEKATRQKLVQMAIEDAKSNAENIAKALNVKLSNIKSVSKFGFRPEYERYVAAAMEVRRDAPVAAATMSTPTVFSMFEVEEKEVEESIIIIYEISKI